MSTPNTSFIQYSPYIRLTKDVSNNYTLWMVTFIPQNFTIPEEPTVDTSNPEVVQVNAYVESGGNPPAANWQAHSLKIDLPTPSNPDASVNVTVYLDDPEDEGSSEMKYDEAEEE